MNNTETPTALIVDDDRAILQLLDDVLQEEGFITTCFAYGQPALEALAERSFDVMLIDQWLPDTNGLEICEAARERYGNEPIVLIITADARPERHLLALELCADDFITKPFHLDELVARIETKLRRAGRFMP